MSERECTLLILKDYILVTKDYVRLEGSEYVYVYEHGEGVTTENNIPMLLKAAGADDIAVQCRIFGMTAFDYIRLVQNGEATQSERHRGSWNESVRLRSIKP